MGDRAGDVVELNPLPRVTDDVTVLVNRVLVAYLVLSLLPAAPSLLAGLESSSIGWDLICGVPLLGCLGWLAAAAVRRAPLRRSTAATATVLLVAALSYPLADPSPHLLIVLWWFVGPVGVAVVLVAGLPVAMTYTTLLAALVNVWRWAPGGDGLPAVTAVSLVLYGAMVVAVIGSIGRGLTAAAQAADERATDVYRDELADAVDRAVAGERQRLDRLIHDDVLTTMVSAAHADEADTAARTAELARATLVRIDELQSEVASAGSLTIEALVQLVVETSRRVSQTVRVHDRTAPQLVRHPVPVLTAEVFLSAMREAVRNAVRHSRASSIEVDCALRRTAAGIELVITITDDGCGFDLEAVPVGRLGINLSIVGSLDAVGAEGRVITRPGSGTRVRLRGSVPEVRRTRPTNPGGASGPLLPERFPAAHLVRLAWAALLVQLLRFTLDPTDVSPIWPTLVAIPVVVALTYVVFQRGGELRLPLRETALAVLLIMVMTVLIVPTLPRDHWPDTGTWFIFVLQLIFVGLAIRRRSAAAVVGLVVYSGAVAWWATETSAVVENLFNALFGSVAFIVLAFLVARQLAVIARREAALRADEAVAIEQAARRHVAVVQRGLWLADLRQTARATLVRIAACTVTIPVQLRQEALLVEAGLREGLVARSVMSEELADMTEAARRRGVSVTFVDSRQSPVPDAVGQAVVAEVRDALSSRTVSRLVVRIGPDGRRQLASVVSEDEGDLNMTMIDAFGARARDGHDG